MDAASLAQRVALEKQITGLAREIKREEEAQRLLGESSRNLQQTINQLLELQKLGIEKNVTFSDNEQADFSALRLEGGALLLNTGRISADIFEAGPLSTNQFVVTDQASGRIDTRTAYFQTGSALIIDASAVGISSSETNTYTLISANAGQLFAGADTNTAATAGTFKDHVDIETSASDRTRFVDEQRERDEAWALLRPHQVLGVVRA